ncbi:MAG: phosphomannose isomerase type II C-terminal cupin domain [Candidatus Paceibacterota bacterium]|jgi:mannose-6-phosphate isomerase-like protein (cupin superfamily)
MAEFRILKEERPWGGFEQFTQNSLSTVKILTIKPGEALSLQSHTKRQEFWKVLSGGGIIEIGDEKYDMLKGDEHIIPLNTKHRATAGSAGLVCLEISTGDFEEDDEIRYEDKYDRA